MPRKRGRDREEKARRQIRQRQTETERDREEKARTQIRQRQ